MSHATTRGAPSCDGLKSEPDVVQLHSSFALKAGDMIPPKAHKKGKQRNHCFPWQLEVQAQSVRQPPCTDSQAPLCLYSSVVLIVSGLPADVAGPKQLFDLFRLFSPVAAFVYPGLNLHQGRYGEVQFRTKESAKEALASLQGARIGNRRLT